jgi:hypothetical protein
MPIKFLVPSVAASAIVLAIAPAQATVMPYTTASAYLGIVSTVSNGTQTAVSDPVDWGQFSQDLGNTTVNNSSIASGSYITTPTTTPVNTGGEKITATAGNSNQFTVYTNGLSGAPATHWNGDFANGVNVLYTGGSSLTLSFATAVVGFGIDLQTVASGAYSFSVAAYNSSNVLLGTATDSGTSTGKNSASYGTAAFAGLISSAGDISYVTVTATSNASLGFAIDTSLVYHYPIQQQTGNNPQTPEPATIALLGFGLLALGVVRRRLKA